MKDWEKHERDRAGLNVKRVGGSGCGWLKGDQVGENWMVEVKTTKARTFPVSTVLMKKAEREAAAEGKSVVMKVVLEVEDKSRTKVYAVLPWDEFILLTGGAE